MNIDIWEIALLLAGITYMMVNLWSIITSTKLLKKLEPLVDKSYKITEKFIDAAIKDMDESENDENI